MAYNAVRTNRLGSRRRRESMNIYKMLAATSILNSPAAQLIEAAELKSPSALEINGRNQCS